MTRHCFLMVGYHGYTSSIAWRQKAHTFTQELVVEIEALGYTVTVYNGVQGIYPSGGKWILHGRSCSLDSLPGTDRLCVDEHLQVGHLDSNGFPASSHFKMTPKLVNALRLFLS